MMGSTSSSRRDLLLGCLCALFVALCFWPGLRGDFILDDGDNIELNTTLHLETLDLASLEQATYSFVARGGLRILPELSLALDHWRGGLDPFVYKQTNLAFHILTTLCLIGLFRTLLGAAGVPPRRRMLLASAMALAWAVHPLQVSSVLYVVQRMQTLCTLFIVLTLWAWLRMRLAQIEGTPSRTLGFLAILCWLLALTSKEDAALFPAYALSLELTLLRFRAVQPVLAKTLRWGFAGLAVSGLLVYLFWVVPHYWSWDAYSARDFSTSERLLTQGRILAMYLGQMVWPLPSHMPFFYDGIEVSRSLWQPATTLLALALLAALLALAWHLRHRRSLLAFGIFLFFAGHFITSNVIGLELAFEHRNQLPLIGIVLAVFDGLLLVVQRFSIKLQATQAFCVCLLIALGCGTWARSSVWGDPNLFAERAPQLAPYSPRAWLTLCLHEHELSNNITNNPHFDRAIAACQQGSTIPTSAAALSLLIQYKTRNGSITQTDWDNYLDRMEHVVLHSESRRTAWNLMTHAMAGERLDPGNVLRAINIVARRTGYTADQFIVIGYFALGNSSLAEDAFGYFEHAVQNLPSDDPQVRDLIEVLRKRKHNEWADQLAAISQENQ